MAAALQALLESYLWEMRVASGGGKMIHFFCKLPCPSTVLAAWFCWHFSLQGGDKSWQESGVVVFGHPERDIRYHE